jgi:hypothetical protein
MLVIEVIILFTLESFLVVWVDCLYFWNSGEALLWNMKDRFERTWNIFYREIGGFLGILCFRELNA